MKTQPRWIRWSLSVAVVFGLLASPEVLAGGKRGGHSGGNARRPPRMSAAHRGNAGASARAPRMSNARSPARANANVARANGGQPRANAGQARINTASPRGNASAARATMAGNFSPNSYQYGSGRNARSYQAYGYGRGYRNRYSAGSAGYGRSQGNTRAIVSRLKSVHRGLSRLQHDYQGHRVQAMHHLAMAVRHLSHRSITSNLNGSRIGQGNVLATGVGARRVGANNGNGVAGANGRRVHMTQAQSDGRMGQALRATQGIALQMSHQGTNGPAHARARGRLQRAMHELNTALVVR